MRTGKAMSTRRSFHVKRLERFDQLQREALGRCASATRTAQRATIAAVLATAAASCGYSEFEMQAQRDKAAQLEQAAVKLYGELLTCRQQQLKPVEQSK